MFPLLCVSLHLALLSVFLFSHIAPLSSVHPKFRVLVTVTCSVSDYPIARPLPSSGISTAVSRPSLFTQKKKKKTPPKLQESLCVCVWAAFSSDLLWAGLDQLSCQAAAGDPPRLFVTVQVWEAKTLPAHHRPLHVHAVQLLLSCTYREREREREESLVYTSY